MCWKTFVKVTRFDSSTKPDLDFSYYPTGNRIRKRVIHNGVETRALKQDVRRNMDRFPDDFMFKLSNSEVNAVVSQNVIPSKKYLGGAIPYAFTDGKQWSNSPRWITLIEKLMCNKNKISNGVNNLSLLLRVSSNQL